MNIWKSLAGMLDVELTSAEPEKALAVISEAGIELHQMQKINELTYRFRIYKNDFQQVQKISTKREEKLRILRRVGFFWSARTLFFRPVIFWGTVLLLILVFVIPTRVFFVRVDGNVKIPAKKILAAAEECGICFGASRREVRSEKVKNELLSVVPELQWAGVNTSGCVATISVRERSDKEIETQKKGATNIVASRDGYILSGTVTSGNAMFRVGQTVKAGQILISAYTDCGICIQATRSEGEIVAQTSRELEVITPSECVQRGNALNTKRKISLLYRKKRINLWKDSGISDTSCGRMYEEYYITLPGGFQLPIALCVETFTSYDTHSAESLRESAEERLCEFAEEYLKQHMVAGEILEKSQNIVCDEGVYRLAGEYICKEMIGREQQE